MIQTIILYVHILCAVMAFLLAPIPIFSQKKKGWHTRVGALYHWLVFAACALSVPVTIEDWDKNWYMLFVAIFSYAFAFVGYRAGVKRGAGWLRWHISGMLGSYIALWTAFLVVGSRSIPILDQVPQIVLWIFPTIVGTPLIYWVRKRAQKTKNSLPSGT